MGATELTSMAKPRASRKSPPKRAGIDRTYFRSVALVVSDKANAKRWYADVLGLDVLDEMDHWVTVGRKGKEGRIHLCQTSDFEKDSQLEPGNSGIMLVVPGDFRTSCAAWKQRGVKFTQEPEKFPWGWAATIQDPDGNEISVVPDD